MLSDDAARRAARPRRFLRDLLIAFLVVLFREKRGAESIERDRRAALSASPSKAGPSTLPRANAHDEAARERLIRYVLRPPLASERLRILPDELVRLQLKTPFSDGTVATDLDPLSLLWRLCAAVPPPRPHTVVYSGVLSSHARWRSRIVPAPPARVATPPTAAAPEPTPDTTAPQQDATSRRRGRSRRRFRAELLVRSSVTTLRFAT